MASYVLLAGRGLIFVLSGFANIAGFESTQQQMGVQDVPLTAVLLVGVLVGEVLEGLLSILDCWARAGATALVSSSFRQRRSSIRTVVSRSS